MAVAIDTTGAGQAGNLSSFSYSHTFSGSNRHAIIVIMTTTGQITSNVTIGAVTCSLITSSRVATGSEQVELWEPDSEPATGAQTVAGTFTSMAHSMINSVSFTGVDTATPSAGLQTNTGTSTSTSVSVTAAVGDFIVDGVRGDNEPTEDVSQVNQYSAGSGGKFGEISTKTGAASVSMDWTFVSGDFAHAAIAVKDGGFGAARRGMISS